MRKYQIVLLKSSFFLLFLSALVILIYQPALNGPFLLDDFSSVVTAKVQKFSIDEFINIATSDNSGPFGRPISAISFALNNYFHSSPFYFKATNLVIHLINTFLVFIFLSRLTGYVEKNSTQSQTYLIYLCTAIWALHPLQVSSVMYVVQRMAILSTTFSLVALILYLQTDFTKSHKHNYIHLLAISISIILASLTKESGVLCVLYIFFLSFYSFLDKRNKTLVQIRYFCFSILAIGLIYFSVNFDKFTAGYTARDFDIFERAVTQLVVVGWYLRMTLMPDINQLSIYHDGFSAIQSITPEVAVSAITIICLAVFTYAFRNRNPTASIGAGLFLLSHVLESTIIPLELVFEHRNYFSVLGITLAVVFLINSLTPDRFKYFLFGFCIIIISMMTLNTYQRAQEWSSHKSLYESAIQNKPNSTRARDDKTNDLARMGNLETVTLHIDESMRALPLRTHLLLQKIFYSASLRREDSDLLTKVQKMLNDYPVTVSEASTLNDIYRFYAKGLITWPEPIELASLFESALSNDKKYINTQAKTVLYGTYYEVLKLSNQPEKARAALSTALQLSPNSAIVKIKWSQELIQENKAQEAYDLINSISKKNYEKFEDHIKPVISQLNEFKLSKN